MSDPGILLVDDDDKLRRVLGLRLEAEGYDVCSAASAEEALKQLPIFRPGLVITDLRMPEIDGLELLERLQKLSPGLPVVLLTAHGGVPDAVAATKAGAVEFFEKPIDRDALVSCLERYLPKHAKGDDAPDWADGLITRNPTMKALIASAGRVAQTQTNVLICGPSGAGKEVLARAIHKASARAGKEFVAINCGAVPAELLESELFGHKKGSFSGATSDHSGLFRAAEGGTVFLDEIGDMPAELQVKLLRVLQEREVRPVGETRSVPVDVRVLSATHRNLSEEVEQGRFREDLFYRLNVISLVLPALNDRRDDVPLLAEHYLAVLRERGLPRRKFSPEALEWLLQKDWPGNVRQLFNMVEQAAVLSPGTMISVEQLGSGAPSSNESAGVQSFDDARDAFARDYLIRLLQIAEGNVSQAARLADRNRTDFYKLLSRHDIDPALFKKKA